VYAKLPEVAQYDFGEAGKCIAFERPTAAAFHLMRGTEGVLLRDRKRDRVKPLLWGSMVNDMKNRRRKPPKELLQNLGNIRESFRNSTQHPEKVYDIQETQDLFGLSVDVVNRMLRNDS
jgi:hypothetical protein